MVLTSATTSHRYGRIIPLIPVGFLGISPLICAKAVDFDIFTIKQAGSLDEDMQYRCKLNPHQLDHY